MSRTSTDWAKKRPFELPKTAAEAKDLGSDRYFTGSLCSYGHRAYRYTKSHRCSMCQKEKARDAYRSGRHLTKDEARARRREEALLEGSGPISQVMARWAR